LATLQSTAECEQALENGLPFTVVELRQFIEYFGHAHGHYLPWAYSSVISLFLADRIGFPGDVL